ncbi:MAG: hypothetical protein M1832_002235 [Thelocarpon impressellum]|nr:MAG: hypothetical protein M1832_002235 [Thelocarpon impressellum]
MAARHTTELINRHKPNLPASTEQHLTEAHSLGLELRQLMRGHPSSPVILTTFSTHQGDPNPPLLTGLTLSTYVPLTLSPVPLIAFSIRIPSSTARALYSSPSHTFRIYFPLPNARGAALSARFSSPKDDKTTAWTGADNDACWGRLGCRVKDSGRLYGDHVMVTGVVKKVIPFGNRDSDGLLEARGGGKAAGEGLVYLDGRYRAVGDIVPAEGNERAGD